MSRKASMSSEEYEEDNSSSNEEEETSRSKGTKSRCNLEDVMKAAKNLSDAARKRVIELGFGELLNITLENMYCNDLIIWLMDKCNPDDRDGIAINVKPGETLYITPDVVHAVLGVPRGKESLPKVDYQEKVKETCRVKGILKTSSLILVTDVIEQIRSSKDTELAVRCFFMVLFNRLLMTTSSYYIGGNEIWLTKDLGQFGKIDWCKAVYDNLKGSILDWQQRKGKNKIEYITGCAPLLLIFYLDNLRSRENLEDDAFLTPRINHYKLDLVKKLIKKAKRIGDGKIFYDNLPLKRREDTCYGTNAATCNVSRPVVQESQEDIVMRISSMETLLSLLIN